MNGTATWPRAPGWAPVVRPATLGSAAALLIALAVVLFASADALGLELLGRHMAVHIALMNLAAPVAALALCRTALCRHPVASRLWLATAVQLALLWAWHMPAALALAHASSLAHALMQGSLLASAFWFWSAVVVQARAAEWRPILALLVTGKLFCLLGVVLTFAPRHLYPSLAGGHAHLGAHGAASSSLADQQLAGLMMLAACPATYVLAGIVIFARWISALGGAPGLSAAPRP